MTSSICDCGSGQRAVFIETVHGCDDPCETPCIASRSPLRVMDKDLFDALLSAIPSDIEVIAHGVGNPARFPWPDATITRPVEVCTTASEPVPPLPNLTVTTRVCKPFAVPHPLPERTLLVVQEHADLLWLLGEGRPLLRRDVLVKSDQWQDEPNVSLAEAIHLFERAGIAIGAARQHWRSGGGRSRPLIRAASMSVDHLQVTPCFHWAGTYQEANLSAVVDMIGGTIDCPSMCSAGTSWRLVARDPIREVTP